MQNKRIDFDDPDITQGHIGSPAAPPEKEDRLVAAVQEYTAAREAGRELKREDLLARYPDVADDLLECLEGLAFVDSAAAGIPGACNNRARPRTAQPPRNRFCAPAGGLPAGAGNRARRDGRGL